jgi:hypothetical protein
MTRSPILIVAPPRELPAWEAALQGRGLEVERATSRGEARAAVARRSPSAVVVSERLPFGGALRVTRELRKDPATKEVPVAVIGLPPLTNGQRLRLGAAAPDTCLKAGTSAEDVATAVVDLLEHGRPPPVELTPAQQAGMRYSRIGTMLMVLGVIFSMPGTGGSQASDSRAWFVLLIPLGGLVSDVATGRVDGRPRLLSWQGWTALALIGVMAAGIVLWPAFFRWPVPQR